MTQTMRDKRLWMIVYLCFGLFVTAIVMSIWIYIANTTKYYPTASQADMLIAEQHNIFDGTNYIRRSEIEYFDVHYTQMNNLMLMRYALEFILLVLPLYIYKLRNDDIQDAIEQKKYQTKKLQYWLWLYLGMLLSGYLGIFVNQPMRYMYGELFIDLEFVMGIAAFTSLLLGFLINQKHQEVRELKKSDETKVKQSKNAIEIQANNTDANNTHNGAISNVESGLGRFTSFISIGLLFIAIPLSFVMLTEDMSQIGFGVIMLGGALVITTLASIILIILSIIGLATYKGKKQALKIGLTVSIIVLVLPFLASFINSTIIYPS